MSRRTQSRLVTIGMSIPVAHGFVRLTNRALAYEVDGFASTFLSLIPAVIGVILGVLVQRFYWMVRRESNLTAVK